LLKSGNRNSETNRLRITLHSYRNPLYAILEHARVARLAFDDPVQFGMGLAVIRVAQEQNRT